MHPRATAVVVYLGDDGNAHELMVADDHSPWVHTDLTSRSGAKTTLGSMLYGCCGSDNVPRAMYLGNDNHIHQFTGVMKTCFHWCSTPLPAAWRPRQVFGPFPTPMCSMAFHRLSTLVPINTFIC